MKLFKFGGLAAVLLVCAQAQEAKTALPDAASILDRYVDVTGGKAAYEKQTSNIATGTMEMPAQGLTAKLTVYSAAPNKQYVVVDIEGMGKVESGSDGRVLWERSPMQGPRIRTGAEAEMFRRTSTFNAPLHWRKLYKKVETTGTETVDGKSCYEVTLTPNESSKTDTQCYDAESGLLLRSRNALSTPMGEMMIETKTADYRAVGSVLAPHLITQVIGPQTAVIKIENVEVNPDIPAARFALPEDIKALAAPAK